MYSYFAVALFSEQEVTNIPHIGVPIFLILKFIFFFGWLEVAKAIDDPWDGNDQEDFKVDTLAGKMISTVSDPGVGVATLLGSWKKLVPGTNPTYYS